MQLSTIFKVAGEIGPAHYLNYFIARTLLHAQGIHHMSHASVCHSRILRCAMFLAAGVALFTPSLAAAVTLPYTNNFDSATTGTALPAEFTETNVGTVAGNSEILDLGGGNKVLRQTVASTSSSTTQIISNSSAALTVTGLPTSSGSSFTISTTFVVDSVTGTRTNTTNGQFTTNLSLVALASANTFSDNTSTQYRLTYTPSASTSGQGALQLSEFGTGVAGLTAVTGTGSTNAVTSTGTITAVPVTDTYTLTLTGLYTGSGITLTGTMTSTGVGTVLTVVGTDTTPRTGDRFGYRTASSATGFSSGSGTSVANEVISFDNLSITAVPEPSTALLTCIGACGALVIFVRRRK